MAAENKKPSTIMLDGTNYPAWKFQVKMTLIREGGWGIVTGEEEIPNEETEAAKYKKYKERKDKALATIGLSLEPSLFHLVGDSMDPAAVWRTLKDQFQRES